MDRFKKIVLEMMEVSDLGRKKALSIGEARTREKIKKALGLVAKENGLKTDNGYGKQRRI